MRLGGGLNWPRLGKQSLSHPSWERGKPRQKDLAPAPEIGAPSPPPPRVADLRQGPWQPHLLSTPQHPCSKPVETMPVPCALCLQEPVRLLWRLLGLGEALEGLRGDSIVPTLPSGAASVQAAPASALSPREPRLHIPTVAARGWHWPAAFLPAPPSLEWAPQALPSSRLLFIAVFLPEPGDVPGGKRGSRFGRDPGLDRMKSVMLAGI